jgi:hypothetical protein
MKKAGFGDCETCAEWSDPLVDGMCEPCRKKLNARTEEALSAIDRQSSYSDLSHEEKAGLARLSNMVAEDVRGLIPEETANWLAEVTIFQLSMAIRSGEPIAVPWVGTFAAYRDAGTGKETIGFASS